MEQQHMFTNRIIWMNNGQIKVSDHETLMKTVPEYAELFLEQSSGNESPANTQKGGMSR